MNTIEQIKQKLDTRYPNVKYSMRPGYVEVLSNNEDGFSVWISEGKGTHTVGYDGWHEEMDSEDDALGCFGSGLNGQARLEICVKGIPYKWQAQYLENGVWSPYSETGLIFYPYWKKQVIVHRQNHLIPIDGNTVISA